MENGGISVAEAINVGLGLTVFVGGIVYALVRVKVLQEEAAKKIETLFKLVNDLRDRINNGRDK
jgi:hypothetical protein|tara:strand:+ start:4382 stop:4573 length:192 start_codon:yes stop_codon:yes gene_type:complete